jgi:hypothetical protein
MKPKILLHTSSPKNIVLLISYIHIVNSPCSSTPGIGIIGHLVADVPSGLGLTPSQETKNYIYIVTYYLLSRRIMNWLRILCLDLLDTLQAELQSLNNTSNYST